jgi:DNA polymerase elongation subunit (family B)
MHLLKFYANSDKNEGVCIFLNKKKICTVKIPFKNYVLSEEILKCKARKETCNLRTLSYSHESIYGPELYKYELEKGSNCSEFKDAAVLEAKLDPTFKFAADRSLYVGGVYNVNIEENNFSLSCSKSYIKDYQIPCAIIQFENDNIHASWRTSLMNENHQFNIQDYGRVLSEIKYPIIMTINFNKYKKNAMRCMKVKEFYRERVCLELEDSKWLVKDESDKHFDVMFSHFKHEPRLLCECIDTRMVELYLCYLKKQFRQFLCMVHLNIEEMFKMEISSLCNYYIMTEMRRMGIAIPDEVNRNIHKISGNKILTPNQHFIGGKVDVYEHGFFFGKFKMSFPKKDVNDYPLKRMINREFDNFASDDIITAMQKLNTYNCENEKFGVHQLDAVSMYPSIILNFNIEPTTIFNEPHCYRCLAFKIKTRREYYKISKEDFINKYMNGNENEFHSLSTSEIDFRCRNETKEVIESYEYVYVCQKKKGFFVQAIKKLYDLKIGLQGINEMIELGCDTGNICSSDGSKQFVKNTKLMLNTCYGWLNKPKLMMLQNNYESASIITQLGRNMISLVEKNLREIAIVLTTDTDGTIFLLPKTYPVKFVFGQKCINVIEKYINEKIRECFFNTFNDTFFLSFKWEYLGSSIVIPRLNAKKQYLTIKKDNTLYKFWQVKKNNFNRSGDSEEVVEMKNKFILKLIELLNSDDLHNFYRRMYEEIITPYFNKYKNGDNLQENKQVTHFLNNYVCFNKEYQIFNKVNVFKEL